jgi:hypothetical protein
MDHTTRCNIPEELNRHPVRQNVTVIIISRDQSDPDISVSASSNSLFKGLPSRLRPVGLQFDIIFVILCYSFLLHDVDKLVFIFLVSRQLCLNFFIPFVVKKGVVGSSYEKFNLD